MTDRTLGSFELMLLLSVMRLREGAYGLSIRHELLDRAHKDVSVGAIYTGLERLERKGFINSWLGAPSAERGGRAKRFYRVTTKGVRLLKETQRAMQGLLDGLDLVGERAHA